MDCLFCKIIAKQIPASLVFEDEKIVAFLDINPVNPGHLLVVPKAHSANTAVAEDDDLVALALAVKKLAPAVMKATGAYGWNLLAVGEDVPHTHWHVIPRQRNDELKHLPGHPYAAGEAAVIAKAISAAL